VHWGNHVNLEVPGRTALVRCMSTARLALPPDGGRAFFYRSLLKSAEVTWLSGDKGLSSDTRFDLFLVCAIVRITIFFR
jgi:hypothetical protein